MGEKCITLVFQNLLRRKKMLQGSVWGKGYLSLQRACKETQRAIGEGRGWQCPQQTNLIRSKSHPVSQSNVGGLLFQTSLNSCVGAPHSHPFFAQCPHEWEINKEIQEVLIWHFVDFFPEPFVSCRYGAPWFWLSWCIFPKMGQSLTWSQSNKEMRKLTLI